MYADVLSFGGTKNGALAAEAVIVMNEELGSEARFQRKQQMQLASKMRYLAAQFVALLEDELWRRSASHANAMATRLADAYRDVTGYMAFSTPDNLRLTGHSQPEPATGIEVIGNFFQVLGVQPALGRLFTADDDRLGTRIPSAGGHRTSARMHRLRTS